MNIIESFDLFCYLEDRGIEYTTSGKNVSQNWIGIKCLWCDDGSNHLGINIHNKVVSCFKCGASGNLPRLIQEIDQCDLGKAYQTIHKYQDSSYQYLDHHERKPSSSVQLPKGCIKYFPGIFRNYFQERSFDLDELAKRYDLYACYLSSDVKFKYRVIIPVYQNYELVTYIGRDVTHSAQVKYQNCPVEKSILPIKDCLYNIDSVRDKAIVVEGVTDVWRLGDGAIATFGTKFTRAQIAKLAGLDKVFVLFDSDAKEEAEKLATEVSGVVRQIEVVLLDQGDPAELSQEQALKLKKNLME